MVSSHYAHVTCDVLITIIWFFLLSHLDWYHMVPIWRPRMWSKIWQLDSLRSTAKPDVIERPWWTFWVQNQWGKIFGPSRFDLQNIRCILFMTFVTKDTLFPRCLKETTLLICRPIFQALLPCFMAAFTLNHSPLSISKGCAINSEAIPKVRSLLGK